MSGKLSISYSENYSTRTTIKNTHAKDGENLFVVPERPNCHAVLYYLFIG